MTDEENPDDAAPDPDAEPSLEADEPEQDVELASPSDEVDEVATAAPHDLSQELPTPSGAGKSSAFMGVPIEIIISVGKARPLVSDLVNLRRDSVITLDSKIDDPVEIFIGDRLIARGELQEMESEDGQLGVRLTEVADLSNGV